MLTFCSVATRQTLPQARVLAASLRTHHPEARTVVLNLDHGGSKHPGDAFELLTVDGLGFAASPDGGLAEAVVTPAAGPARMLEWALELGAEVAVYLDPWLEVHASLDALVRQALDRQIVLVRRVKHLPEDGERPDLNDVLVAGRVSPSFVVVAGTEGRRFASWWRSGVERSPAPGRWLELADEVFPAARFLEDPGVLVGYWNLHERPLQRSGETLTAGGAPLRVLDFSGLRPDRPYLMAEFATRVRPLDDPLLAELCGAYAERVLEAGWRPPETDLSAEERFGNGLPMSPLLAGLWKEAEAEGQTFGSPTSTLAAEAFEAWLRSPAPAGGSAGVNRYLHGVYMRRPDLQAALPDLDVDGADLVAWAWEHGRRELTLVAELLPTVSGIELDADAHLTVSVVGYLRDTLGIGEAARLYILALDAARVPVATTAVSPDVPAAAGTIVKRSGQQAYEERQTASEPAFNLVCMNGDHLVSLMKTGTAELLGDRPTIGHWAWETDVLPPSWVPGFNYVDEIWVNSNFVAEKLGRLSPVPIVVIPQAITRPQVGTLDPALVPGEQFTFLFLFDFFSTLQRKNPLGLIEAFTRAFAPGDGPRLVLKTINERFRPAAAAEVREKIGNRPDIHLVDRYLEPHETAALLARADCYVSLHRSEGFGLTLAESMTLGTPVIATGYSGNMDFTTARNSYLVDWATTRVGPECEVYPADGTWAEPDLDHAAELMRQVWHHPEEAAVKAARARRDIERLYAPATAGAVARARLEALHDRRRTRSRREAAGSFGAIERELALDLRRGVPSQRRVATAMRRVMLRLMLPFTVHERNLDRAVLNALRDLRSGLESERARGARTRARLRRLETAVAERKGEDR